jgi:hypothetical protein
MIVGTVFLLSITVHSEVSYQPAPKGNGSPWATDSLWVGADIVTAEACTVKVVRKGGFSMARGALYFVWPDVADSTRFLFHNRLDLYPDESSEVVLGVFKPGTRLVFMYMVTDSVGRFAQFARKRLYSGQCRKGTDVYVSQVTSGGYGYRHAAAGSSANSTVIVGFNDGISGGFNATVFRASCAQLVK